MCVTICEICLDEDASYYGNRIRVKYTAKWDAWNITYHHEPLRQSLHLMPQAPAFLSGWPRLLDQDCIYFVFEYMDIRRLNTTFGKQTPVSAGASVPQSGYCFISTVKSWRFRLFTPRFLPQDPARSTSPLIMSFYQSIQPQLLCQFPKALTGCYQESHKSEVQRKPQMLLLRA